MVLSRFQHDEYDLYSAFEADTSIESNWFSFTIIFAQHTHIYIYTHISFVTKHCRGRVQLSMQSVPIPTNIVSSNPTQARCTVIKFVSDLRQVCGFLRVLRFPPPIKLTATI